MIGSQLYLLLQMSNASQALIKRGGLQLRSETDTVVRQQPFGKNRGIAMLDDPVLELLEIDTFALGE